MKKRLTISKLLAAASLVAAFCTTGFAQKNETNLGSACGCPSVTSRSVYKLSTNTLIPFTTANGIAELTSNAHFTCDKIWVIDSTLTGGKIYVPNGITLTIDPGTLVQGDPTSSNNAAGATCIVVERGGKIIAQGTKECNIVMTTTEDHLDGTYSITNVSRWGGLVICGIASNTIVATYNNVSGGLGTAYDGVGHCEGFNAANAGNLFGGGDPAFPTANDNDNSGILQYVSVRHPGAILNGAGSGNEINGISLYSVGRGTTIDHVEVIASGDDDIEYFGGTVNMHYISTYFGDDDKYDFDLGYSGRGQFYFSIASDTLNTGNLHTSDNGFECDADDQFACEDYSGTHPTLQNHSNPIFFNCTMIGNGHIIPSVDNTGGAAIQAKELTGGQWYNCIFANWRSGLHLAEARSTATNNRKGDAYDQWTNNASDPWLYSGPTGPGAAQSQILKVKNCIFVTPNDGKHFPFTRGVLVNIDGSQKYIKNPPIPNFGSFMNITPTAADSVQFFTTDGNLAPTSLAGIDYNWSFAGGSGGAHTSFSNEFHVQPLPSASGITSSITPAAQFPSETFFSNVNFKGAFDPNATNGSWLSDYGLMIVNSLAKSNPTDINQDGVTDINDFLLLVGKFGQQDQ